MKEGITTRWKVVSTGSRNKLRFCDLVITRNNLGSILTVIYEFGNIFKNMLLFGFKFVITDFRKQSLPVLMADLTNLR
jgi:hypothetical protein